MTCQGVDCLSAQMFALRLALAEMPNAEQLAAARRRRGYWIRRGRERRGWGLDKLAAELGRPATYASTVSLWERGLRAVPGDLFDPLAVLLRLPPEFLVRPPLTDDDRLDRAMTAAAAQEREDWDEGLDQGQEAGDVPGDEPDTRSA